MLLLKMTSTGETHSILHSESTKCIRFRVENRRDERFSELSGFLMLLDKSYLLLLNFGQKSLTILKLLAVDHVCNSGMKSSSSSNCKLMFI